MWCIAGGGGHLTWPSARRWRRVWCMSIQPPSTGPSAISSTTPSSGVRPAPRCASSSRTAGSSVSDRGPGIADEDLPHIFERFYRAPDARGMPGAGLGLAIVGSVAQANEGTVEVRTGPGGVRHSPSRFRPSRATPGNSRLDSAGIRSRPAFHVGSWWPGGRNSFPAVSGGPESDGSAYRPASHCAQSKTRSTVTGVPTFQPGGSRARRFGTDRHSRADRTNSASTRTASA